MRFNSFLTALERDVEQATALTMKKGTDSHARPYITIHNAQGVALVEISYTTNGYGKAMRVIRLRRDDGSWYTNCSTGKNMAKGIVVYLTRYTQLPNALLVLKKGGVYL